MRYILFSNLTLKGILLEGVYQCHLQIIWLFELHRPHNTGGRATSVPKPGESSNEVGELRLFLGMWERSEMSVVVGERE